MKTRSGSGTGVSDGKEGRRPRKMTHGICNFLHVWRGRHAVDLSREIDDEGRRGEHACARDVVSHLELIAGMIVLV